MALRISRASSSTLARQLYRPLSTSSRRYQDVTYPTSTGAHANDGPPTSVAYPRTKTTTTTTNAASPASTTTNTPPAPNNKHKKPHNTQNKNKSTTNDNNPLRLDFTPHASKTQPYRIHVLCTPNNTHVLISDPHGHSLKAANWSGGSCGFKGVNRSGYEAGYQCAVRAFARIKQLAEEQGAVGMGLGVVPRARFEVLFSGFGRGRDAVFKALMTSEGDDVRPYVVRVTDKTPIKIGGTRARKTRRL